MITWIYKNLTFLDILKNEFKLQNGELFICQLLPHVKDLQLMVENEHTLIKSKYIYYGQKPENNLRPDV